MQCRHSLFLRVALALRRSIDWDSFTAGSHAQHRSALVEHLQSAIRCPMLETTMLAAALASRTGAPEQERQKPEDRQKLI